MLQQQGWLKCDISDGMFPDEFAVVCNSIDHGPFSFFAPQEIVNKETGSIRVEVVETNDTYFLVFLPVIPLEDITRTIKVDKSTVIDIS